MRQETYCLKSWNDNLQAVTPAAAGVTATGIDALRGKDMSQKIRVLIVDGDKATRKLYRGILKEFPEFQVREAKNGKEALALIGESTPDIVVSGLIMRCCSKGITLNPAFSGKPVNAYEKL